MTNNEKNRIKSFIKRQKQSYKRLKPCYCPALQETIYFNADGLNHLLYHRRRPRNIIEQRYRAGLIKYINKVIKKSTRAIKDIKRVKNPQIITWSLQHKIDKQLFIKVIVIKKGAGKIYFLSTMKKRNFKTKKPRTKF